MFKSHRKLLRLSVLLACLILAAGGAAIGLRNTAASGAAARPATAAASKLQIQESASSEYKAVPTAGDVTVHGAGKPNLYFQDGRDLPESADGLQARSNGSPVSMLSADVDGDGRRDIVTVYSDGNGGSYLATRNADGQGHFTDLRTSALPVGHPESLRVADVNLDGVPDLAMAETGGNRVVLALGDGAGGFGAATELRIGSEVTALATGDVAHRGLQSLIVGDRAGEFRVVAQTESTQPYSAVEPTVYKASAPVTGIEVLDMTGDGHSDVVVATTAGVELWAGNGKGDFARRDTLAASGRVVSFVVGDMTLDGFPDVAAATANGAVTAWNNLKGAGFSAGQTFAGSDGAVRLKLDWINEDAWRDLVVVDRDNSRLAVLLNKKGRGFGAPALIAVDSKPVDVTIGKFDIDGVSDIVVAKQGGGSQAVALTFVPNQAAQIVVTDLSRLRQIPANGTTTDIQALVTARRRVTFLDAITAANNTPGPQTIQFQVSDACAGNIAVTPPSLAGQNLREPGLPDDPLVNRSIFPPNILSNAGDLSGNRLYNISLVGAAPVTGLTSLVLTSPNGDGTVIVGENTAGNNNLGELCDGNINKLGPDYRIIGDNIYNTGFEVGAANCRFESLILTGFTRAGTQGGPGASAIEFSGVQSSAGQVRDCYFGPYDLFGSAQFLGSNPTLFSYRNNVLPVELFTGNVRAVRINGSANTIIASTVTPPTGYSGRTLIGGNTDHGILIEGGSPTNQVNDVWIGLLRNGSTSLGNGFTLAPNSGSAGIEIRNNVAGAPSTDAVQVNRCVIVACGTNGTNGATAPDRAGIMMTAVGNNNGPRNCRITNNIIGLQSDGINPPFFPGLIPVRNTGNGILVERAAQFNTFTTNTVSANFVNGFLVRDLGTNQNTLTGNRVGTDSTGRLSNGGNNDRGNQQNGVVVADEAALNILDNNTVSNNINDGVQIVDTFNGSAHPFPNGNQGTDGNIIRNNKIGTDINATDRNLGAVLGNGRNGVRLGLGPGGDDGNVQLNTFSKNLIFFNGAANFGGDGNGILMQGRNCDLNVITQNSIAGNRERGIRLVTGLIGDPTLDPNREGPNAPTVSPSVDDYAQEKMTVTNDDDGTSIMPELPANPPVFPVNQPRAAITVDSALLNGSVLQVSGRLGRRYVSGPNLYTIEIFASSTSANIANHAAGIAQRFLGSTTVAATVTPSTWRITTTGANIGDLITATLRSPSGSTSEIAVGKLVDQGPVSGTPSFSLNRVTTNQNQTISLTPITTLDFGDVPINTTVSATVRLLSTGTGGAPITVNAITLTNAGTNATFALNTSGNTFPVTLSPTETPTGSPGSFIDFIVTANPKTIALLTGEVTINVTTTVAQNFVLPLRVNGTGQQISTNPACGSTVSFGTVTVGQIGNIQNVTITNTGTAPLSVTLTLTGDFVFDSGFVTSGPAINPNGVLTVPIRFRPTTTGTRNGTLSIAHDAVNIASPCVINLTGTGQAPPAPVLGSITINGVPVGNIIDFGTVVVGNNATRQLVLSNTGNANLIYNATVSGDAFSGTTGNQTIAPGGTSTLLITFTPPTVGDFNGVLQIASNAQNLPNVAISLTGKGVAPSISLNPTAINFGTVPVNQTGTQPVSITNTGGAVLTVNSIQVNGQGFQASGAPGTPFQVQPGATQSFNVTFTPNASGAFSGTLTVTSNARNAASVSASLSGNGGDNTAPTVTLIDPRSGQAFAAGSRTTVRFQATDNIGVTGIDVQFSDGGAFSNVVTNLPGSTTSFDLTFGSSVNSTNARVRVVARDAAGNTGNAESGSFTVGPAPLVIGPKFKVNGKLRVEGAGSNIAATGAQLLINNNPAALIFKDKKGRFLTASSVESLVPRGVTVQLSVRNPNGVTGPSVSFSR